MRIASLLPSATEMVCAVGARDHLVGVSHECDFPPGLDGVPSLTRPRSTMPQGSGAIDQAVREILKNAVSVYEVDVDRLRAAKPDLIVTQTLCEVCAVSTHDVQRALRELAGEDVAVVSLEPTRLADVWQDLRRVGEATDRLEAGNAAAEQLEERVAHIGRRSQATNPGRPGVLTIEWLDPVMIGGLWMPELVELAGGSPLVTETGQHAPTLDREALESLDPEVVLIKPCGYSLDQTQRELPLLRAALPPHWRAVTEGHVFLTDGNAYFNRPGPRLVESLEILAACVHPDAFPDLVDRHREALRVLDPQGQIQDFPPPR